MTGRVVATIGEPVDLGGGARLVVTSITDSRCPEGVMCVWAGELEADVQWTGTSGDYALHPMWSYQTPPVPVPGGERFLTILDTSADGKSAVLWILDDPCGPVDGQPSSFPDC